MQYYRCKCGESQSWGSYGPAACTSCPKCGSDLALGPELHRDPAPHQFERPTVDTDDGPVPGVTICIRCNRTKKDLEEKAEAEKV
jgi:hypothetical protein